MPWRIATLVVGALLMAPSIFGGGARRRDELRARLRTARDAAGEAFLALDLTQRHVDAQVERSARLDGGERGAALRRGLEPLAARAQEVSADYVAAIDAANALEAQDRPSATAVEGWARHLDELTPALRAVDAALGEFSAASAGVVQAIEADSRAVAAAMQRGLEGYEQARALVARAREQGLVSPRVEASAEEARSTASELSGRLADLGPQRARQLAARLAEQARTLREQAEQLPALAERADRDLASLRTRVEIVTGRLDQVAGWLRPLRQRYSAASSADVEAAAAAAPADLARARELLAQGRTLLAEGRAEEAATAMTRARERLAAADDAASGVRDRLELLQRAEQDPRVISDPGWFALRDAQKLVLAQPGPPDVRWVNRLDTAVRALEDAQAAVRRGIHPDYGQLIRATAEARQAAALVVAQVRERLADGS